jgi:hypothetical protein
MIVFRPLSLVLATFVFAITPAVVTAQTTQKRPTAPVGYLIAFGKADRSKMSDGKPYHIVGVTRSWKTRSELVKTINSYHRFRPIVIELKTEAEYKAGEALVEKDKEPATSRPAANPRPATPPAAASVAGTRWRWGGDTMYFYANGTYERVEFTQGAVSNLRGKWTQAGNKLTLSNDGTWTLDGDRMSNGLATRTKLK